MCFFTKQCIVITTLSFLTFHSSEALLIKQKMILQGHGDAITKILFLQNGDIATAANDKTIRIWHEGSCIKKMDSINDIPSTLLELDATTLVSGGKDGMIEFWNMNNSSCIKSHFCYRGGAVVVLIKKENEDVLVGKASGLILSIPKNGDLTIPKKQPKKKGMRFLEMSMGNAMLYLKDKTLFIMNPLIPKSIKVFNASVNTPKNDISAVANLKNGTVAAAFVNYNNILDSEDPYEFFPYTVSIKLWHDNKIVKKLKGHSGRIICLLELPNGFLVSGSHDGSVKFWDVKDDVKQNDSCVGDITCKCPVTSMMYGGGDLYVGMNDGDVLVYTIG